MAIAAALAAVLVLWPCLRNAREAARRAACQGNLKQWALILRFYAEQNDGLYPPLSSEPGRFCFDAEAIYPTYMTDPRVMMCPGNTNIPSPEDPLVLIDDHSYFYLGYVILNDTQARAFLRAYKERIETGAGFHEDLLVYEEAGSAAPTSIRRLRASQDGVENSENPAVVPVAFGRSPDLHAPGGVNVLYLDGHTEFVPVESEFPSRKWFLDALAALEAPG